VNYQSPLDESSFRCLEDKPVFNTVLIYEGLAAGRRAKHFYEKLTAEFGGDFRFTEDAWSFKVLGLAPIANAAASAAAAADLVIFSVSGTSQLPLKVEEWIESWVRLINQGNPALVALFDSPIANSAVTIRAYLRKVTESKRLDFFPHSTFLAIRPGSLSENG
jgi:hypothetical protein